jgi:ribosome-binding protein aMBF1 (putative translation factor)
MARKFNELVEKMPAEARERAETKAEKLIAEYALDELREARSMTQARLADILGKDQSVISRIEKRTDMYVSTLAEFIRAMGGELEIRAVFPEGSVRIRRFGDIAG